MTTAKFIAKQNYSYIISYSFNRGAKMMQLAEAAKVLFQSVRRNLLAADSAKLPAMRAQLRNLEQVWGLDLMSLTEPNGSFHITATPIAKIYAGTDEAKQLRDILLTPVVNQYDWMCAPLYRDALAFYDDDDKLINVLNICFGCDQMLANTQKQISADAATYKALRHYLTDMGHDITER
jgi:hypothetical protein